MRLSFTLALLALPLSPALADVPKPAALTADGVPAIPDALLADTRPYLESRSAGVVDWNPVDRSLLISTRFANVAQLHNVRAAGADRRQITFEADRVAGARYSPKGDALVVTKDVGGSEFFQLYTLKDGKLSLVTDGKSRNAFGAWSKDGRLVGYTSTRRTGADNDIYVVNPRDPKTDRLVIQRKGGGWGVLDFTPDNKTALVGEYVSITKSNLHLLDIASGTITPLTDATKDVSFGDAEIAADGTIWAISDEGSDFQRLGTIDRAGKFTAVDAQAKWDVEDFAVSDDGSFVAYLVNEAGFSTLKLLDPRTRRSRTVAALPKGVAGGLEIAPWGDIAVTVSSPQISGDAFVVDPRTLAVTRWTQSETGGLDASRNAATELVSVKSFDGEEVTGFLFRPDAAKFPGKRPLLIDIHGGPEGQERPSYNGTVNYLINELGVAVFYPNVRGSSGFGKRFVSLDNGPFKREDSVKDIGAFLDHFGKDRGVDEARIAVTGGSYGGYMCYASAIRYGARLKAANCIVAISNFVTFLENTQSYRRDLRRVEYGDERDAAQKAKLIEISPMTRVSELKIPLMVVTGGNDPRVPASEADQIVKAVRANGRTAWHLLAADEGHGYAKKDNRDYAFLASLLFWRTHLLGEGAAK